MAETLQQMAVLVGRMLVHIIVIIAMSRISSSEAPFEIDFTCSNKQFDISSLECSTCSTNLSPSLDKSTCLSCNSPATFNSSLSKCTCNSHDYYLFDSENAINCAQCPSDHAVSSTKNNGYECVLCESPRTIDAANNNRCSCPNTHISSGKACVTSSDATTITNTYSLTQSKQVSFKNIDTSEIVTITNSLLFEYYFLDAAVNCNIYKDITACQILGNLCVLTMYSDAHNVCILFTSTSNSINTPSNGFSNWKQNLPFLFYPNHDIITSTALSSSLSVSLNDKLSIILIKYSMNGTMIGQQDLGNELFYFCRDMISVDDQEKFRKIGYNTDISCSYDLSKIFNSSSNTTDYDNLIFYDPYLYISSQNKYYPLPVYVDNIDNSDGFKIVRRFFISDNFASNNNVLMFIESVTFKVTIYSENKIYPPLIQIKYGMNKLSDSKTVDISFSGSYMTDLSSFETSIIILFVITLILIVAIWIYKVYKYQRMQLINTMNPNGPQNIQQSLDIVWFIRIIFIGFGVSSHLFFWLLFFVSSYCYLSVKGQSNIKFLLPQDDNSMITAFKALLIYCFLGKLFHVLMLIWDQCNVDVFFIDWEKPKGNVMAMIQQQQYIYQQQQQQRPQQNSIRNAFMQQQQQQQQWGMNMTYPNQINQQNNFSPNNQMINQMRNEYNNNNINKPISDLGIISCWRKLFVANEWNELSIYRNISPGLTFLIFLSFMTGFEYEYLSLQTPVGSGSNEELNIIPISNVYKFVISTFFFLIIYFCEYLYFFFINDRFFGSDGFIDLIDLSSLANISIFILNSRYHGFYIHGKTIHQHSDTSLEEINKNIENERRNLCKSRGLIPDQDVFEIFVSTQFRQQYDEIYRDVLQFELNKLNQQKRLSFNINPNSNQQQQQQVNTQENYNIILSKQLIESSKLLSMFLCDFIEKSCPHKWEIRDLIGWERFFGPLPNLLMERNSIFYQDIMYKFKTELMYIGLQYHLIILNILTFCFIDFIILTKHNTIISLLITYIIDYILLKIRSYFGEKNVSRKTMIDQKFLL